MFRIFVFLLFALTASAQQLPVAVTSVTVGSPNSTITIGAADGVADMANFGIGDTIYCLHEDGSFLRLGIVASTPLTASSLEAEIVGDVLPPVGQVCYLSKYSEVSFIPYSVVSIDLNFYMSVYFRARMYEVVMTSDKDAPFTILTESKTYNFPTAAARRPNAKRTFLNKTRGFVSLDGSDGINGLNTYILSPDATVELVYDSGDEIWRVTQESRNFVYFKPTLNAVSENAFGSIGLETDTLPIGWYDMEASVAYSVNANTTGIGSKSLFSGNVDSGNGCSRIWNYNNAATGWKEADTNIAGESVIEVGGTNGATGHVKFACRFHVSDPGVYSIEMGVEEGGSANINREGSFIKISPLNTAQ